MNEVKIIYCYDKNGEPIHYSKTKKGEKYFCIDCGSELICKEGTKKVKHLAHKNTENCGGTGESIFHKHWKENLFKAGMFINIANSISEPRNVEILEVLNEVSLNKKYNMKWDIEIIVDILLITEEGDIVVEINYKNPKNWDKLKSYYEELNLLRVYEVTVDKHINTKLEWFCLGESEEITELKKQRQLEELRRGEEKEKIKKEKKEKRERLKKEAQAEQERLEKENLKNGTWKMKKILINFKTPLEYIDENSYVLYCLYEKDNNQYERIDLEFNINKLKCTERKLEKTFDVRYGIKYCWVIVNSTQQDDGFYEVVKFNNTIDYNYDKRLYARLCNIA